MSDSALKNDLYDFDFTTARGRSWRMKPVSLDDPKLEDKIDRSIKKNGQFGSRSLEWDFDFDTLTGLIFVGGCRQVGTIKASPVSARSLIADLPCGDLERTP